MSRRIRKPATRTDFLTEQDEDDFEWFLDKGREQKQTRLANKKAARKRRQQLKDKRYEDDWN